MTQTVADRLRGARRRAFVGRTAELELFSAALAAPEPPFSVLWIHGPGGVGKSTLLDALAERAPEPVRVDLRAVEPSPPAFHAAVSHALGRERPVLLLDTFEAAGGLEDWLREEFIPQLPAGALLVIAGRARPAAAWRRDPGWRDLLRVVSLRNLGPEEARAFLRAADVPDTEHDRVLELTHGHPLALSLLLDVLAQDGAPLELGAVPDVVSRLVESFLAGVPTSRHRHALEIAAQARFTTAALLRAAFGDAAGEELFAWLRELSFVECATHGVSPHDLARDALVADLRWRDPATFERLHRLVRREVMDRITAAEGRAQEHALADLMFLHRANPTAPAFWDWESLGDVYADRLREEDRAPVLAMVERHEGRESAAITAHWLERQPQAFAVFRGQGPEPVGFLAQLALHEARPEDLARDPGAEAAWAYAQRQSPPRPGDEVVMGRQFMDRDAYQAPSRSLNVLTMRSTQEWVGRRRLAWYFITWGDPQTVAPLMAYIDFQPAPAAGFAVGGRAYTVYARDWRRSPIGEWLELMAERELGAEPTPPPTAAAPALALSQQEFAGAVRRALRDLHRPADLAANPLRRCRVAADQDLPRLLGAAVEALAGDPRDAKLARALDRTYVRPAPTQEAAADLLGLPFSTYRGHLTRGVERVVEWLWQRELYGAD